MTEYFVEDEALMTIKNAKDFNAQAFAEAAIEERSEDGSIDADRIVYAARDNQAHPARRHLEWDNEVAGHKHRVHQVRAMLRLVSTILPGKIEAVPAFPNLPAKTGGGRGYYEVTEVVSSERLTSLLLEQAERDLRAWQARYGMLVDVAEYAQAMMAAVKAKQEATSRPRRRKGDETRDQPPA